MRAVLHLCREHGKDLGWWTTLDRGEQALLMADLRIRDREWMQAVKGKR